MCGAATTSSTGRAMRNFMRLLLRRRFVSRSPGIGARARHAQRDGRHFEQPLFANRLAALSTELVLPLFYAADRCDEHRDLLTIAMHGFDLHDLRAQTGTHLLPVHGMSECI